MTTKKITSLFWLHPFWRWLSFSLRPFRPPFSLLGKTSSVFFSNSTKKGKILPNQAVKLSMNFSRCSSLCILVPPIDTLFTHLFYVAYSFYNMKNYRSNPMMKCLNSYTQPKTRPINHEGNHPSQCNSISKGKCRPFPAICFSFYDRNGCQTGDIDQRKQHQDISNQWSKS